MLNRLICLILGYFIGAIIQTGFWIGKFNHIDIRDYGSGNAGTTNTMRTLGKKAGFITYFMDAFKSCITAIIIHFIYGSNSDISEMLLILYGDPCDDHGSAEGGKTAAEPILGDLYRVGGQLPGKPSGTYHPEDLSGG